LSNGEEYVDDGNPSSKLPEKVQALAKADMQTDPGRAGKRHSCPFRLAVKLR
jgi:hypothetical protein